MIPINRRAMLGTGATMVVGAAAQAREGDSVPQPIEGEMGATDLGPRNVERDRQNSNLLTPPPTDKGLVPNLRFSFSERI